MSKKRDPADDPNFNRAAQAVFDALNDDNNIGMGWTWSGIAKAFGRRYGVSDLETFRDMLDMEIKERSE